MNLGFTNFILAINWMTRQYKTYIKITTLT